MNIHINRFILATLAGMPAAPVFADAGEPAGAASALSSLLLPLGLLVAAAAFATFLLTRWKGSVIRREGPLQLIQLLPLGPRERLALVKAGDRYLVVGITPNGISRIAEFAQLDQAAAALIFQAPGNSSDSGERQPPAL